MPPSICRFCGEEIYGGTVGYWHYWDVETRNFLCTSQAGINHPYHPAVNIKKKSIRRRLWTFLTNS